jgi:hypothetical protein
LKRFHQHPNVIAPSICLVATVFVLIANGRDRSESRTEPTAAPAEESFPYRLEWKRHFGFHVHLLPDAAVGDDGTLWVTANPPDPARCI